MLNRGRATHVIVFSEGCIETRIRVPAERSLSLIAGWSWIRSQFASVMKLSQFHISTDRAG